MANIYIARKDIQDLVATDVPGDHSYFVYDPDGNPNSGDERIIRGGPTNSGFDYVLEVDRAIADSRDALGGDDPFDDRYYTTVASGTTTALDAIWDDMIDAANALGSTVSDPDFSGKSVVTLPEDDYFLLAPNCNTLTRTIGDAGGIDVVNNLPKIGGDPGSGERVSIREFVGITSQFDSTGDNSVTVDPSIKAYFDQGGNDDYTLDPATLPYYKTIDIFEDSDGGTTDRIYLQNVDPGDVTMKRDLNGELAIFIDGRDVPIIRIHGQFDGSGVPKIDTLWVVPSVGSPSSLPLDDPDDFPLGHDGPVGGWVPFFLTPFGIAEGYNVSPLVLDLGTGGINLTSMSGSGAVYWDLDQDGFRELSGWIAGNSALLAIDKNSDGVINDNGELFGNDATYANGFANLAQYDSNTDGHITSSDAQFSNLIVWTDDNHDGYSQSGEMHTLASLSITDISLTYSSSSATINGNAIKQTGTFTMGGVSHAIVDAWFAYDPMNTRYDEDYTLNIQTLFLPDQRGYGDLADLHIAMSQDSTLLDMVQDFALLSTEDVLDSAFDLKNALTDILYRWAGVDAVSPTSRGAYANAQQLAFMEALVGHGFYGSYTLNPGSLTVPYLNEAWDQALGHLGGTLLMQSGLADIFANPGYNPITDTLSAGDFEDGITLRFNTPAQNNTLSNSGNNDVYVFHAGDSSSPSWDTVIETTSGGTDTILFGGIDPDDVRMWNDGSNNLYIKYSSSDIVRLNGSGSSGISTISSYVEQIAFDDNTVWDLTQGLPLTDTDDAHTLSGSAQNDVLDGRGGADSVNGYGGNDTLLGGAGGDAIDGGDGNDTITGGTGSDQLYGGTGNDVFVFEVGDSTTGSGDFVNENTGGGTDTIHLSGVDPDNVLIWTDYYNKLFISYATGEKITVNGSGAFYSVSTISDYIEHITFDDSTDWNLTQGLFLRDTSDGNTLFGSAQNDFIDGRSGSDSVNGYGGNDTLLGGDGADTLNGGDGDDIIEGQGGNDTLNGDGGTDTLSYSTATSAITISLASGSAQATGGAGTDTVTGFENLIGSAYNDTLTGNSSANTINGGAGTNSLTGGGGADIFAFDPAVTMNNIQDFSTAQGDKLDISALIENFDPITHAITDWVQITQSGSNSALFVDADGTGSTYGFNQVASLIGATGLTDEAALLAAGTLIV